MDRDAGHPALTNADADPGGARAALDRGCELLARGESRQAMAWFDRAARLRPDDRAVELLRASALLESDLPACRAALVRLIAKHPRLRDARTLLIACESRDHRPAEAATALAAALRGFAPHDEQGFRRLADRVASGIAAPGWVGLDALGVVTLSAASRARIVLKLDGVPVPVEKSGLSTPLPPDWRHARELTASRKGKPLLGSPLPIAPFAATEGFVDREPGGDITGWAWHPADPDRAPTLRLEVLDPAGASLGGTQLTAMEPITVADSGPRHERYAIRVPAATLPAEGRIHVSGLDGRDLAGSPIELRQERRAARAAATRIAALYGARSRGVEDHAPDGWRPLAVSLLGTAPGAPRTLPPRRPIDVVIPVYRNSADFEACLASLRGHLPGCSRIVAVDDHSPDPGLREALAAAEARGEIHLLRHATNRGFPTAANTGLRFSAESRPRDVLLLNPDTLLPPGAVGRLAAIAYSAADIGTATPMTNDGTILSYPRIDAPNPVPDLARTLELDRLFAAAHGDLTVDIPTGVGFCMFIRHDCLAEAGLLREDVFAQGYGEENDFCLRASHLGWRHVAASGVFVSHVGGQSFGAVKSQLIARNLRLLNRLHPGYDAMIEAFVARDPLAPIRRGVDLARWRGQTRSGPAIVLITHDKAGGVARHVRERAAAMRAQGVRPIVVHPGADGASVRITDGEDSSGLENLRFRLPRELGDLVALLAPGETAHVELHHMIGHAPEMLDLATRLGAPLDVYIHDYAQWCPRVTLVTHGHRYCGEPTRVEDCRACVADLGSRLEEPIEVAALRARSAAILGAARRVIVPSQDSARRVRRQFPGVEPVVGAWEDEAALLASGTAARAGRRPPVGDRGRIAVPGAIGYDKGFQVVLDCARDAARRDLPLEFVVVGHTLDDARLIETGRVFVTGQYEEADGVTLLRAQNAAAGFIPSVWPETWCYALSLIWQAGLAAVAFDIGAQAERIKRARAGAVMPVGLPAPRVNDLLLSFLAAL